MLSLHLLKNFQLKILIFDPYSEVSKTTEWYIDFLKILCACGLGELVAWHLVDKRGVKTNPWEGGGLGFDSGWWRLIP
jgi:hypothetical protein